MKNFFLIFPFLIIFLSCKYQTEIKRKRHIIKDSILQKELKVDTIAKKDLETLITKKDEPEIIKVDDGEVIMLPNNRYAVVVLDYDNSNERNCISQKIKVYDRTTKKQVPETRLDDYFANQHDGMENDMILYGDFNFDGKMDVAIRGEEMGYRSFSHWNFYLAMSRGYKFSKSFSAIMNWPISYFELDAKNKKIIAYRDAELDESFEYKVIKNKAKLIRIFSSSRQSDGPFFSSFDNYYNDKKKISQKEIKFIRLDIWEKDYKYSVLSFDIKNSKKKVKIFIDDDSKKLYYTQIERKDSVVSFDYSGAFNYNLKNNALIFKDRKTLYRVYDNKNDVGIETIRNGKITKFNGDIKSKKGNLSELLIMKKEIEKDGIRPVENMVVEK